MDDFWLWLYSLTGVGSGTIFRLRKRFGDTSDPRAVFSTLLRINTSMSKQSLEGWQLHIRRIRDVLDARTIDVLPYWSERYPPLLREIYDPPAFLFCLGRHEILRKTRMVTIVGTRSMTEYGRHAVQEILPHITAAGVGIVSGLAHGVDTCVHHETLQSERGIPIAVLPGGPLGGYPASNEHLFSKIVSRGCVLWEFLPGIPLKRELFALRNRILAGLTECTVVVESLTQGGSLITARSALASNRSVGAVPGSIFSDYSFGTNDLLSQGAFVVRSSWDVLSILDPRYVSSEKREIHCAGKDYVTRVLCCYPGKEDAFWAKLVEHGIELSELETYSKLGAPEVMQNLTRLELAGILRRDRDGKIKLNR